jgi:hypothetical protein
MSLFKLPREIITFIFRFAHLSPQEVLSLQRTSKKIKNYLWKAVDRLDLNEWSVDVDPNILLDRLDCRVVRLLDLTGYNFIDSKGIELSTSDILRRYPSLEILKLDEIPDCDFAELERTIPTHKSLIEISILGDKSEDKHLAIAEQIRFVMKSKKPTFNQFLDLPTFNCEVAEFVKIAQCPSSCKIVFSSEITSNGINVGATFLGGYDGSIFVIAKQNGALRITQTIKEHDGPITRLQHMLHISKTDLIFAASEDGTVSKWQWSKSKLTLVCKYSLPEPIYFVAAINESRVAVASKHNLYFIVNERISDKTHHFEEKITDLEVCTRIRCLLLQDDAHSICIATATRCYETENFQEMSPMLNVGPFFKRRYAVTSPLQAYFSDKCASKLSLEILAMQLHYTVTSLGSIIQIEYEGSDQCILARLSPRISREEISAKKFPECKSLWYSKNYLYAVFSNNKLYRWCLGIEGRYERISTDDD